MSADRITLIRAWVAEGKSLRWIGRQINLTGSRVQQIARANGIVPAGASVDAKRKHGAALAEWIRQHPEARGSRRHSDHDTRLGAIMWAAAAGKTYDETARLLGVTRNVIAGMAHRHHIRFGAR